VYFLGLRLNTYIASALAIIGLVWFWRIQRRPDPESAPDPAPAEASVPAEASEPDPGPEPDHAPTASTPSQEPQESHNSESTHG